MRHSRTTYISLIKGGRILSTADYLRTQFTIRSTNFNKQTQEHLALSVRGPRFIRQDFVLSVRGC